MVTSDETRDEIIRLFKEDGWKQVPLAAMFGLSVSSIDKIIRGKQRATSLADITIQEPHHPRYRKRFWERVDTNPHKLKRNNEELSCWEWLGGHDRGYGIYRAGTKRYYTHVYAWEIENNKPSGLRRLTHICGNLGCCNPAHLKLSSTAKGIYHHKGGRKGGRKGYKGKEETNGPAPIDTTNSPTP